MQSFVVPDRQGSFQVLDFNMSVGTLILHHSGVHFESSVETELDYTKRHEIVAGQTLSATTLDVDVYLNGAVSTHLAIGSITRSLDNKKLQFKVTDGGSAVVGNIYNLNCQTSLSGGATIVETLNVEVQGPE